MSRAHPLPVCSKCGWHDGHSHASECDPKAGAAAVALSLKFADVKSTKLGYGFGCLTFEFDKDHAITFRVTHAGEFEVARFFWLGDLDAKGASQLVKLLSEAPR